MESDLTQRRANPIVDRYVTTDLPLRAILENAPRPLPPLPECLLYFEECLDGNRLAKDAITAAQAARFDLADPELLTLLLSSWAEVSCRIGRPSDAEALVHRTRALVSDGTHPEIRARAMLVESILADAVGNKAKREQTLREILTFVAPHSPRRKFYVWDLAMFLAQQGRGEELAAEIKELSWQSTEQFRIGRVLMVQFVNAVETGRIQDAAHLVPQIESGPPVLKDLSPISYNGYQALLRLMHEELRKKELSAEPAPNLPTWLKIVRALLVRNTDEALRLARLEAGKLLGAIFASGFNSFDLVRAELAAGKSESARRLLNMRRARGNKHYLDDLFFTRAELLDENRSVAARHFAEVLKSVEQYRARGRLDFELLLACELSQGDIVQLTRSAERISQRSKRQVSSTSTPTSREPRAPQTALKTLLGRSPAISEVRDAIFQFAKLDAPILITGETGTGKELVARALREAGGRAEHPFIPVNCGSITETLLESELFGHERGAFTGADRANKGLFEEAGTGTIFLDEIGDISTHLQKTLLRVLETGEIRAVGSAHTRKIACRVIAATNADLTGLTEQGRFRKDLLYRLQRLCIHIPPLRERRQDIPLLFRHFLDFGRRIGIHAAVSNRLREAILSYDWPGNVRELKNVTERIRLMHSDKLSYDIEDLDLKFRSVAVGKKPDESAPAPIERREEETEMTRLSRAADSSTHEEAAAPKPAAEPPDITPKEPIRSDDIDGLLLSGKSQIRRLDRLRDLFTRYRKLTRNEVIRVLGISPNTATKDLNALIEEGFIERVEPSASTRSHYFVRVTSPTA